MKIRSRSKPARASARGRPDRVGARSRSGSRRDLLVLQDCCTVAHAEGLKAALCALAAHPEPVILDAAAVQRVDTAALQLLAAFIRDRRLAGRAVRWQAPSAALAGAARLLGMGPMLQLEGAGR